MHQVFGVVDAEVSQKIPQLTVYTPTIELRGLYKAKNLINPCLSHLCCISGLCFSLCHVTFELGEIFRKEVGSVLQKQLFDRFIRDRPKFTRPGILGIGADEIHHCVIAKPKSLLFESPVQGVAAKVTTRHSRKNILQLSVNPRFIGHKFSTPFPEQTLNFVPSFFLEQLWENNF